MSAPRNCFTSVSATPYYGAGKCVVRWALLPELVGTAGVSIYQSTDGLSWELVSDPAQPDTSGEFLATLPPLTRLDQVQWRLDCEPLNGAGQIVLGSQDIDPTSNAMRRSDIRDVSRAIMAEIIRLRRGAGLPCWILAPLQRGEVSAQVDPITTMRTTLPCWCTDDTFTQIYQGGFSHPYQSWLQLKGAQTVQQDRGDGSGTSERVAVSARLPAFPFPRRDYLVVVPGTGKRYAVGAAITPYQHRGVTPVCFDVELTELVPSDPRYRLLMPPLDPRLAQPSYAK